MYTAHWDHLGVGDPVNGDKIYNGALDNASGVATVLEIARAFTQTAAAAEAVDPLPDGDGRREGPARIAEYYSVTPLYPLGQDRREHQHRRRQPVGTHEGHHRHRPRRVGSRRLPAARPRRTGPHAAGPIRSRRRASTTARITSTSRSRACPRSTPDSGVDFIGKSAGVRQEEARRVHRARLPRAVRRGQTGLGSRGRRRGRRAAVAVGYRVANADKMPEWKPGNEFKAKRDAMLKQ